MTKVNLNHLSNLSVTNEIPDVLTNRNRHPIRSEKYSVITSMDIITQVSEEQGLTWEKVAEENNTRKFKGYGTHVVRCFHPEHTFGNAKLDKDYKAIFYMRNSYTGRCKFEMYVGIIHRVKLNGLVLGNLFKTIKIKHIGLTAEEVSNEVEKMKEVFVGEVAPYVLSLQEKMLTERQMLEYAETSLRERVRLNANFIKGVNTQELLKGVPVVDGKASLWDTLTAVQENLGLNFRSSPVDVRYQYLAKDKDNNDQIKERKVSRLKNIQEVTYMNKFLFDVATEYLKKLE